MKIAKIAVPVLLFALVATGAKSQTFKTDYSTKLILAGNGNDPVNTLTLSATSGTAPISLVFPNAGTAASYVLKSDGLGGLVWSNISGSGITSIIGTSPINASTVSGVATISITSGALTSSGSITVGGTGGTVGSGITADLDMSNPNTWLSLQTFNDGLTEAGGAANIATTDASSVNVGTGAFANAIDIGNGNGSTGTYSTTTIDGAVNIDGTLTLGPGTTLNLPAGSITNNDLANSSIAFTSTNNTLTVPASIALGSTGDFELNLTTPNIWTGTGAQTFSATGTGLIVTTGFQYTGTTPASGDILESDASGNATWVLPSSLGVTSVVGTAPIHVSTTLGVATVSVTSGAVTSTGSSITLTGTGETVGSGLNADLNLTNPNSWGALQTFNDGLTEAGGTANIATTDASSVNVGTGAFANAIDIGNGNGSTGTYSTTTIDGAVNIDGTLTLGPGTTLNLPAGSITNNDLANSSIAFTSTNNTLTVPASIALGSTGDFELNLTTPNIWTGTGAQTFSATGTGLIVTTGFQYTGTTPASGDILESDASGNATWVLPSSLGVTSVVGTAPIHVSTTLGVATVSVTSGAVTSTGSSITLTGTGETVGSGLNADLNLTNPNSWGALQTFNDGLTAGGGQTNLNTGDNNKVNIADGGGATNAISIGYGTAPLSLPYTTTTIGGAVNFTGSVSLPAGSITAGSLGLATNDVFFGNASGNADTGTVSQDVTFENGAAHVITATVNSSNATTFAVVHAETVGSTLNVTGQTTLGSTALSASSTVTAADPLVLTAGHSYFPLSGSATVNSITGANTAAGQIIVLVNTNPPPTAAGNYITLHSNGTLVLNGSDVIIGAGGSATLISDGTNWHLISAE